MTKQAKDSAENLRMKALEGLEEHVLDENSLDSSIKSALEAGNDPSDIYAALRNSLEKKLTPLRRQAEGSRSTKEALKIEKSPEYQMLEYLLKVAGRRNIPIYKGELHSCYSKGPRYVSARLIELFEEEVSQARGVGKTDLKKFIPQD